MTALHQLAEQIIDDEKAVMAPPYKRIMPFRLTFERVEIEQRTERKDLQPDVVGVLEDGTRWFIEIRNTHEVDEKKKKKLIESGITCLEINVREQTLDNLKEFLLKSDDNRKWINCPNYERQLVSGILQCLKPDLEIELPPCGNLFKKSRRIRISHFKVLSKSDDGLYAKCKVISEGKPYIFFVGSIEILERDRNLPVYEKGCDELEICTDYYSPPNIVYISWKYIYKLEEEIKMGNFEKKTKCYPCKHYQPFWSCEYEVCKRDNLIVCNKRKRLDDEALDNPNKRNVIKPLDESLPFSRNDVDEDDECPF